MCDKMSALMFVRCERATHFSLTNPVCSYEENLMVCFAL